MSEPLPPSVLFGRDAEVTRLAASRAPLTVLTGDSGVGKTSILEAAQDRTQGALAPPPRTVPFSGGVLQRVLLEGLADVIALDAAQRGSLSDAARHLGEAAEKMIEEGAAELVRVVGREALAMLRGRLGDDVGAAVAAYASALRATVDDQLAVRLTSALDREAAATVIKIAEEVRTRLGADLVVVALDAGERLSETDVGVLADLAEEMPDGIRIRLAVATYDAGRHRTVERLRAVGQPRVAEIAVDGIAEDGIRAWLAAAGLDAEVAPAVTRATGGYALHVGDLITHLLEGGEIAEQTLDQRLADRTEEAWAQLDPGIAEAARRLCVLVDPLPRSASIDLLASNPAAWGEIEDRLREARIFSVEVNGLPWFHEQRRRYLAERKLGADERSAASAAAVEALKAHIDETDETERLGELAEIASHATQLLDENEQLRAAVALNPAELAVSSALIELIEPNMHPGPVVEGDQLLRHARRVFAVDGLVEALGALGDSGLVLTANHGRATAVVPAFNDSLVASVIVGRGQTTLTRPPVPGAAGAAFATLVRPALEPFRIGGYGIGDATLERLGDETLALRRRLGGGAASRDDIGANLLLRADYGGRPFYAHLCFDDQEARNAAYSRLVDLRTEVFDQPFAVTDAVIHPSAPVPAARFLRAAERLGAGFKIDTRSLRATRERDPAITPAQSLEDRVGAMSLIRTLSSTEERYAYRIEQPVGYLYSFEGDARMTAEIVGARQLAEEAQHLLTLDLSTPYWTYRVEQQAELAENEHVGIVNYGVGRGPTNDAFADLLTDLAKRAAAYNATQPHLPVPLDETLVELLERSLRQSLSDARTLRESGLFGTDLDPPSPYDWLVQVSYGDRNGPFGFFATADAAAFPSDGADDSVTFEVVESLTPMGERVADDRPATWTRGEAQSVLASLLGHREEDVRLLYTQSG
jgi:hypothetical protein